MASWKSHLDPCLSTKLVSPIFRRALFDDPYRRLCSSHHLASLTSSFFCHHSRAECRRTFFDCDFLCRPGFPRGPWTLVIYSVSFEFMFRFLMFIFVDFAFFASLPIPHRNFVPDFDCGARSIAELGSRPSFSIRPLPVVEGIGSQKVRPLSHFCPLQEETRFCTPLSHFGALGFPKYCCAQRSGVRTCNIFSELTSSSRPAFSREVDFFSYSSKSAGVLLKSRIRPSKTNAFFSFSKKSVGVLLKNRLRP